MKKLHCSWALHALFANLILVPTAAAQQRVGDTQFSEDRGFYELPFDVVITSATPGATIRYTLDGSDPTNSSSFSGGSSPLTVRIDPNSTNGGLRVLTPCVTLRAYAFKAGMTSSNVDTHTYVFLQEVLTQTRPSGYPFGYAYNMDPNVVNDPRYSGRILDDLKSIPTMSIVMSKDDMFGSNGVYPSPASSVEKVGSLEVIYPGSRSDSQANCGFRPHSHILNKRNFRLYFRSTYGPPKLVHDLFRDSVEGNESSVNRFDRLVLRAGVNDNLQSGFGGRLARATYITDELARASQSAMSGFGPRGIFVHLYINGLYWGLYNPVERPDDGFTSEYFGGTKEQWMAINHGGVLSGTLASFQTAMRTRGSWATAVAGIDIESFCDYILYYCYSGGGDWPGNNWYAGVRELPARNKLRFFVWDCEDSWIRLSGRSNDGAWINPDLLNGTAPISTLWNTLDNYPEFRLAFADRVYKHCFNDGALSMNKMRARWDKLRAMIDGGIVGESARWGRLKSGGGLWTHHGHWAPYVNSVRTLFVGNESRLVSALRNTNVPVSHPAYYPSIDPPLFKFGSATIRVTRAVVTPGFRMDLLRDGSSGTIYYTTNGVDPRSPSGAVQGINGGTSTSLTVQGPVHVKARTKSGNEWSALHEIGLSVQSTPSLEIHEFMALNTEGIVDEQGEHEDWIEIYNHGRGGIDLSGYHLTDDLQQPTKWTFPSGTAIPEGTALLVWADNELDGPLHATFKLAGGGESIALFAPGGVNQIDAFSYGLQTADVSMGRMTGRPDLWVSFPDSTPGYVNQPRPCGHLPYSGPNSASIAFKLVAKGVPVLGERLTYDVDDAPPFSVVILALGLATQQVNMGFGTLLVDPPMFITAVADGAGDADFWTPIPDNNVWRGQTMYAQSLYFDGVGLGLSNAIISRFCQ